ncbi:MAG TPA: hypothetical protein VJU87_06645 [Gemmatimonadaceae bacterium]|nr:hypothetical protein [Gemmatimonadaceae bacterium]
MSQRRKMRSSWIAVVLVLASVAPLGAQQQVLLDWSGRVDSLARIRIQGSGAHVSLIGSAQQDLGQLHIRNALPHRDGTVSVQVASGRGDVTIAQQPTADNDYTAVVLVRDHSGGTDQYQLTALWTPGLAGAVMGGDVEMNRSMRRGERDSNVSSVGMLHWSGDVDKTVVVRWQGDRASLENVAGAAPRQVRAQVAGTGLPDRDVIVRIVKHDGRGDVTVEQQPTAANGYRAVIRIDDEEEGFGHYDFDVVFDRR